MAKPKTVPYPKFPSASTAYYDLPTFRGGRLFVFSISSPTNLSVSMYPVSLALYTPPNSVEESMNKTKNIVPTYGGFVEFVWPDELTTITCSGSTGGFIGPDLGLTGDPGNRFGNRRETVAYELYQDFLELFRNNGMILDSDGRPALRGRVIMAYDRGIFIGHFARFEVSESADSPFMFELSWSFKVESCTYRFPHNLAQPGVTGAT